MGAKTVPPPSSALSLPRGARASASDDIRLREDLCSYASGCGLSVGILLWPSFTLHALSGFIDALRLAADIGDRGRQILCQWTVMSPDGEPVTASCGLRIAATSKLLDPSRFDYLVVVAGHTDAITREEYAALQYLRSAASAGIPLVGLCTGSFAIAEAGLLDGRQACVANYHYREFADRYPKVRVIYDQLYSCDDDRITCAGGLASIDLAASLVEKHCGRERAIKISHNMMVHSFRGPSEAQRVVRLEQGRVEDMRVIRAISLMEQNVARPFPIASIARELNISERQLERAFRRELGERPLRLYRRLRVHYGYWRLHHTTSSISEIALDCGFSDHSHFTRCFSREFGETPSAQRRRSAAGDPLPPPPPLFRGPEPTSPRAASGLR